MYLEWNWTKLSLNSYEAGFMIGETKEMTHEEIEEGNVIRTDPKAGKEC